MIIYCGQVFGGMMLGLFLKTSRTISVPFRGYKVVGTEGQTSVFFSPVGPICLSFYAVRTELKRGGPHFLLKTYRPYGTKEIRVAFYL